jgi:predicted Zn-dependent protease
MPYNGIGDSHDFFEKVQMLEKRKPGTMSKLFSTHPPTGDRIAKSQKEIADLKARPEYVSRPPSSMT